MSQAAFVDTGSRQTDEGAHPFSRAEAVADIAAFFDVSLDLLVIRDLEGVVVKASRSWLSLMGYNPAQLEGRKLLSLVHPEDMPGTHNSVFEVESRKVGQPILGFINRYRHSDGHYRTLEWRAQRFENRIYGVARDVTNKVAAERELIEAKAAAESANRAKSDFLANMSHEIRTPLNGVIGIADVLARTPLNAEQAELVELIRDSGATLERLVSDILDMSKIEAGQVDLEARPFDLERVLTACVEVARLGAEAKGLEFRLDIDAAARGQFVGDSTRLRQVLTNLLSNAVKFTAQGEVGLTVRLDETTTTLIVEDTGVGFNAEEATRLFERFSQADDSITRRFGGSGLGLSICRSLVEMMGGEISATSTPGVGSRFEVRLPLVRAAIQTGVTSSENAMGAAGLRSGRRLRVLLAEDHPVNQRVAQAILASQGAEVVTVGDGAEAVAAFQRGGFDLVLMDMQMPVMDGLAATRKIRAFEVEQGLAPTAVVMLSANALPEHQAQAAEAGADLHVSKPITTASLLAGIETALA